MTATTKLEMQHIGKTQGTPNHDHDMLQELTRRLDSIWRYDQYIANAENDESLQKLWRKCKSQDIEDVQNLKSRIAEHIKDGCF